MKMIMSVLSKKNSENVLNALVNEGLMVTYGETRGGLLRQSQVALYIAVSEELVPNVMEIIRSHCKSQSHVHNIQQSDQGVHQMDSGDFEVGGAVTFIWEIDRIVKY